MADPQGGDAAAPGTEPGSPPASPGPPPAAAPSSNTPPEAVLAPSAAAAAGAAGGSGALPADPPPPPAAPSTNTPPEAILDPSTAAAAGAGAPPADPQAAPAAASTTTPPEAVLPPPAGDPPVAAPAPQLAPEAPPPVADPAVTAPSVTEDGDAAASQAGQERTQEDAPRTPPGAAAAPAAHGLSLEDADALDGVLTELAAAEAALVAVAGSLDDAQRTQARQAAWEEEPLELTTKADVLRSVAQVRGNVARLRGRADRTQAAGRGLLHSFAAAAEAEAAGAHRAAAASRGAAAAASLAQAGLSTAHRMQQDLAAHMAGPRRGCTPVGWAAYMDGASGRVYYHHSSRGVTQWERPAAPVDASRLYQTPDTPLVRR
eukprot:TRINITY_DN27899_c0_g1_i1.p1 TRINITY_DN27899_c0_g1~~TRINITY_DN27899_c0_g1_i1.p1  ORF type:complete len:382 (+),score=71.89 TRINITY_DN27899_c0_g1_i1:24-1148(+)